jgi:hypothetical protein
VSILSRFASLTMTSSPEKIEHLDWQIFLSSCGYETSVKALTDSKRAISVKRRGKQYDFAANRISPNSIQITASEIRFPLARILGCGGFRLHAYECENVAFEIFEITLEARLINSLGDLCTSLKPDTNTPETDQIVELIIQFAPNLLLPAKGNSRVRHVFAHFAIVGDVQFLAVSSDRFNYDDWLELEQFKAIRKTIYDFGGKHLEFLTS